MILNRQDAKDAKKNIYEFKQKQEIILIHYRFMSSFFPWRPWRLGGKNS
jgi:hypothetical protein